MHAGSYLSIAARLKLTLRLDERFQSGLTEPFDPREFCEIEVKPKWPLWPQQALTTPYRFTCQNYVVATPRVTPNVNFGQEFFLSRRAGLPIFEGHSGNPFGRPRAAKSSRTLIPQMLDEEVCITENGKERVLSKLQVILMQVVNKAAMGDRKFLALLLEYMPAIDATLHRPLTPEIVERVKILVRGRLD